MECLFYDIKQEKPSDKFNFYPIGDVHLGTISCDEKRLKRTINKVKEDPFGYAILMGDLAEFISAKDPRWDGGMIAPWMGQNTSRVINMQLGRIFELFEPISGKTIGAIKGNHEATMEKHGSVDVHDMICRHLAIKNLSYSAFIRLRFKYKTSLHSVTIYAHHGHGGGRKAGAKINRIHDMGADYEADIYLMGHTHERGWAPQKPMLRMKAKLEEISSRERYYGHTGSYLKTCELGESGYAEKAGYPPTSTGGIQFTIEPCHKFKRLDAPMPKITTYCE